MISFLKRYHITKSECLHLAASHAITGCLSSSPISLLLSEASLPPLRVTLTDFTLSSYERALRLPNSFPISGLTRLGVKPRLCISSWRAFASTHLFMLPSTSPREAILACPPFPPWNLPFFTVKSTLSSLCSCYDPPLPPHDLVLWTDGSVPSPLGKGSSGVLANCSFCGTEATLSFPAGPVCSNFSTDACAILQALCWSRQHQQAFHFSSLLLLSDCRSIFSTLSSPPSFLLPQTLWQIWQELSSLSRSIRLQWVPDIRFSQVTKQLMSWSDTEHYLHPLQSLVVFLFLSLIFTLVFSWTGGILSHLNSSTHRFPQFPPRNLCSLVMLAVFSLIYAATDEALC